MKALTLALVSVAFTASAAFAADDMKKGDAMMKSGDGMMKKDTMTMQQCKDHMAMSKKDGMKKDDAMMKKDAMCAEMMKSDSMMAPGMAASGTMMKK